MFLFLTALFCFFILEILYFRIADKFNIIDKPNQRSSHSQLTLRGGGIIFPIALIIGIIIFQPSQYYLAIGVFAIAGISFLDDVVTLNNKLRISVHFFSVILTLIQIFINQHLLISSFFNLASCFLFVVSIIIVIGIINAYNFMDGINGITVLYSLVTVFSCFYIQNHLNIKLLNNQVFYLLFASLIVFAFFNLRKRAKAFAGDVGSIAMAMIISFFIATLIIATQDFKYILLLGVYGLDSVATIVCRIIRKENIFDAHRSHFYQFLANDKKWPHVFISAIYAVFQLLINTALIYSSTSQAYIVYLAMVILYIIFRLKFEGKRRLFVTY